MSPKLNKKRLLPTAPALSTALRKKLWSFAEHPLTLLCASIVLAVIGTIASLLFAWVVLALSIYRSRFFESSSKKWQNVGNGGLILFAGLTLLAVGVLRARSERTETYDPHLTPLRGLLVAGRSPSPLSRCNVPPGETAIYFGNSVASTTSQSFSLIETANEKLFFVERTSDGMLVSATIRDPSYNIVATIKQNVFRAESNSNYQAKSPDSQTLYILDGQDHVVLFIQYLNPFAMKVLGQFYYRGYKPIVIEDDKQIIFGNTIVLGCFGDFTGSALSG